MAPSRAWKLNTAVGDSAYGFCIRNRAGELLLMGLKKKKKKKKKNEVRGSLIEEKEAVVFGLEKARQYGYENGVVECSCYDLIRKLNIGDDVGETVFRQTSCSFSYVHESGNYVAKLISELEIEGGGDEMILRDFAPEIVRTAQWDFDCYLQLLIPSLSPQQQPPPQPQPQQYQPPPQPQQHSPPSPQPEAPQPDAPPWQPMLVKGFRRVIRFMKDFIIGPT